LEIDVRHIEELKNYFAPKVLSGKSLPNPKTVTDNTVFYKQESDGVFVEHIMFNGRWNKKVVDLNSNVVLEQV